MLNLGNLKKYISGDESLKLYDFIDEEDVWEQADVILLHTPENVGIEGKLNDQDLKLYLIEHEGYEDEEIDITEDMRVEYGLMLLNDEDRLEENTMSSSRELFYRAIEIDSNIYYLAYFIDYVNKGMGGEVEAGEEDLLGVFSSIEEIKCRLEELDIISEYTPKEKFKRLGSKIVLEYWEY
jgi:hypothetical protein